MFLCYIPILQQEREMQIKAAAKTKSWVFVNAMTDMEEKMATPWSKMYSRVALIMPTIPIYNGSC